MSSNVKSWRSTRCSLAALARCSAAMLLVLAGLLGISQPTSAAEGEFINISTRANVGTGEEVMIGGFIIEDGPRQVAIHALGPELANRSVSNALADPVLRLIDTTDPDNHRELMFNDDWNDSQGQMLTDIWGSALPFSAGSKGSGVVLDLEPGSYTAIVEGKNGTSGIALVEVWKFDSPGADGNFVNISTRAVVKTGDEVMIGGFIVRDGPRQVAIHALGPELANRGVSNALADPVLRLIDTTDPDNHIELMVNDDWEDSQGQLLADLWGPGLSFSAGSKSSAAVLTLEPGNYTAIVEGKDGTAGIALVEVLRIESPGTGTMSVVISDANLRLAIENALGKVNGAPITPYEMATLTDLEAPNSGIKDLTGLEYATNLRRLDFDSRHVSVEGSGNRNEISDLSPLSGLSSLTQLILGNNNITDLSPLSSLSNLERLHLSGNRITDVKSLSGLTNLTRLYLGSNNITEVSALSGLTNLIDLRLYWNSITDLSPLSGLTNLEWLHLTGNGITEVSALSGLINLTNLFISANAITEVSPFSGLTNLQKLNLYFNSVTDVSPLSGLTNLTELYLGYNNITDVSPLSGLTKLQRLYLDNNSITDVSALSTLINLTSLYLGSNSIREVSALSTLTNLRRLYLDNNKIKDLAPLVTNTGLGGNAELRVKGNPLSATSITEHVPALETRGVSVSFDETVEFTDPQIYNDNVFVLPVLEDLATGDLPLNNYATRFYEHFSDAFDFLIFFPSLNLEQLDPDAFKGAYHASVGNDVQGMGKESFFDGSWGSAGKLQSGLFFASVSFSGLEHSRLVRGPMLHELMHRWANFIVEPAAPHWDFTSANGILGGFDISTLEDHGEGRYSALNAYTGGWALNLKPYSPIELYLAGLIPPEEVPDLWVAEDGKIVERDGDRDVFTASQVKTYTIQDIIAEHGARVPDHTQSQKAFRAAVILLVSEDYPAVRQSLDALSNDATLFSHAGEDLFDDWYNFYEATGGRATIAMDGLSQFKSSAAVKRPMVRSFGTPPPPIMSHFECEH